MACVRACHERVLCSSVECEVSLPTANGLCYHAHAPEHELMCVGDEWRIGMEFLERHWWVSVLGSLVAVAVMIVGPVAFLQQVLPSAAYLGESPTPDILLAGALAVAASMLCFRLTSVAVRGRHRARLRAETLRGNLAVMPISLLPADAQKAPDVSRDPLVLSWRASMTQSVHSAAVSLLMAVFWGFILVLTWAGVIINFSRFLAIVQEQWLPFAGILVATPVYIALMAVLIPYLPTLFGKPFGLTASDKGISYRTAFGREGFMRWEEMKLLEMEQYGLAITRREFSLYGQNARRVIAWKDNPQTSRSEFVPDGMSQAEMTVRLQELLHLINARTGLVPRTFSKALRSKEVQFTATQGQAHALHGGMDTTSPTGENAGIGVLVLGAGITLALAVTVILVPISSVFVLNTAVASSLIILALILIVYTLRVIFQQRPASNSPVLSPAIQATSFQDTPESIYALSFGMPSRRRLVMGILGLLMAIDAVPALLIIVPTVLHVFVRPMAARDSTARGPSGILLFAVAFYGIGGIMLLIATFWPVTWNVRATRSALSLTSSMKNSRALPWESIERITANMRRGEVVQYTVVGDLGRTNILWFAEPSTLRAALPIDGTTPIAPDQLAALAAQRSGKAIKVVHA